MDINKFYHLDRRFDDFKPFPEFDNIFSLFLNDNRLVRLLFHSEDGKIVNDLDLHISNKGMSPEMLDVLHSIQQETPYVSGISFNQSSQSDVDKYIFDTIVSRYDQFGSFLEENMERISQLIEHDKAPEQSTDNNP